MNSQDIQNLQESYLAVYDDETRETLEFGNWVNDLLDEGYDLSDYTWDELYETYIGEERAPGVKPYEPRKRRPLDPEKKLSGEQGDGSGYGDDTKFKKPDDKIKKPGTEVPAPKKGGYGRIFSNIPYGIGAHGNRNRSRNSTIRGMDPGAPRSEKIAPKEKTKSSKEVVRKTKNEEVDIYDIILSHLLDEEYADTYEAAEAIMVNMSEDWRDSVVEAYVDYKKGKLPSGRTPQQAAQGRTELLNARDRNRPSNQSPLDGTWGRQQHQNRITKEMDTLTAGNPVSRAVRRGLGDMLPGGEPSTNRHREAMDRRNRVADLQSAEKKSRG